MYFVSFDVLLPCIAVFAILLIIERQCIKKRKKWEWVIPILVTAMIFGFSFQMSKEQMYHGGLGKYDFGEGTKPENTFGVHVLYDSDRGSHKLLGISKLIIGTTGENTKYIDLEFKDGELVGTPEALVYKEEIEKGLFAFNTKEFSGRSLSYEELERMRDMQQPDITHSPAKMVTAFAVMSVILIIFWGMPIWYRWQRKKKNQLNKSKLEDL